MYIDNKLKLSIVNFNIKLCHRNIFLIDIEQGDMPSLKQDGDEMCGIS